MRLIFATQSARDKASPGRTSERLVNLHAIPAPEGARAAMELRSVLGTRGFATVPGPFLRALTTAAGKLWTVSRGTVSRIEESGAVTGIGVVTDDARTSLVGAGGERVAICAGGAYHLWDGSTLAQISGGRLTSIGSIAYSNGYVLMAEAGGTEIEWTSPGAPQTRNALYFAKAASRDDKIVRLMAVGDLVWVLKERSTEIWAVQGTGTGAWAPVPGATRERGLRDFRLCCALPDGLFYVGDDNVAYVGGGAASQPVSTPVVDQALADSEPTHCLYYEDRGDRLCVIRFADRPAWCLNLGTGRWHERAEGVALDPWGAVASARCWGQWHIGGRLGAVWRLGRTPVDADGVMRRLAVSRVLETGGRFTVASLNVYGSFGTAEIEENAPAWLLDEFGFPVTDNAGHPVHMESPEPVTTWRRAPRATFRLSRDGGMTWGLAKVRDFGRLGAYRTRVRLGPSGQFRTMAVEFSMTDPVEMPLLAEADIE